MKETTLGQELINSVLPEEFRIKDRVLGKSELNALLSEIAKKYPEKYKDISFKIMSLGRQAAFQEGVTLSLDDLILPLDKQSLLDEITKAEQAILNDPKSTKEQKESALEEIYQKTQKLLIDQTYNKALELNNPFAIQVKSKARGSPVQLTALLTTPGVYQDGRGKTIPVFIRKSYAEGLDPHEYWAATYGARRGVISTKFATRDAGYLGKQLGAAVADVVVTEDDCQTPYGVPVPANDEDNIGAVLARPAGRFESGTVITKQVLGELIKNNIDEIVVRSPITCGAHVGVCKFCAGQREDGNFPPIGYHLGQNAASAVAERIAQGQLNLKHCLSAETDVLMGDWSVKKIKDIVAGDFVMGATYTGKLFPAKVLNVFNNGVREVYRTYFSHPFSCDKNDYLVLDSTLDHKVLSRICLDETENPVLLANQLVPVGKKAVSYYAVFPFCFLDKNYGFNDIADLLLGYLSGAPYTADNVLGLFFVCYDDLFIKDLNVEYEKYGISFVPDKNKQHYYQVLSSNTKYSVSSLMRFVLHTQKTEDFPRTIPFHIHDWSNISVARFIGGLFSAIGSIFSEEDTSIVLTFKSCYHNLLVCLKQLLMFRFGILSSSIDKIKFNEFDYEYCLKIFAPDMVVKFIKHIPLYGSHYRKIIDLLVEFKGDHHVVSTYGFPRVKQEFIGMLPTYDLEVATDDHLFVLANGLIVSNSSGQKQHVGSDDDEYVGFDVIESLLQIPENLPYRATVAESAGKVEAISPAPQGGTNIVINGVTHYVRPNLKPVVKLGDKVEAGDRLSSGVISPDDVVRLKGIGEGRRYLAMQFTKTLKNSGYDTNRRNIEVLSRSLVDHVIVEDPNGLGDHLPGDLVRYSAVNYNYKPRPTAKMLSTDQALGKYLEQPVLHYSLGTQVTESVANTLKKHGITDVLADDSPPLLKPQMVSLVKVPEYFDDWMARLSSNYLKSRLTSDVHFGSESNIHGVHPIPGIAKGVEFGQSKKDKFTY